MRLRWLLLALVTLSLLPSLASARSVVLLKQPPVRPNIDYTIGAAFEPGLHAGKLVLAFYNRDQSRSIEMPIRVLAGTVQYDWLTVEISNVTTSRTLTFVEDRDRSATQMATIGPQATVFETIDLDPMTADLPPGEYAVDVTWAGHYAKTITRVPYRCGLAYSHMSQSPVLPSFTSSPAAPSPSKLPYLLGGLALASLVTARIAKRAGTADRRVPCSAL